MLLSESVYFNRQCPPPNETFHCPLHHVLPSICPHVIQWDLLVGFSWSWIFGSSNKIYWLYLPTVEDTLHEDILLFLCMSCEVFIVAKNVSSESCSEEWKMFCFQHMFPVLLFLRELNRRVQMPYNCYMVHVLLFHWLCVQSFCSNIENMFAVTVTIESAFDIVIYELYYFYLPKKYLWTCTIGDSALQLQSWGNVEEMWDTFGSNTLESPSWILNFSSYLKVLIFMDVCWRRRSWSTVFFSNFERIKFCNISVPSLFSLFIFKKSRSFVYVGTHLHLQKVPKNRHHVYN